MEQILKFIAQGEFGLVYKLHDLSIGLNNELALKI